jgi:hypothetical protein
MLKAGTIPYNSLIKNMEDIRGGQDPDVPLGLNDNLQYLSGIYHSCGGQTLSLFNSHDEESPSSNYQNMIWPAAAFLVLSSYGPIMYHISHLPGAKKASLQERFDLAYTECWNTGSTTGFAIPGMKKPEPQTHSLALSVSGRLRQISSRIVSVCR